MYSKLLISFFVVFISFMRSAIAYETVEDWIDVALKEEYAAALNSPDFAKLLLASPTRNVKRLANLIRNNPKSNLVEYCIVALNEIGTLESEYELISLSKEFMLKKEISDSVKLTLLDNIARKGVLSELYMRSLSSVSLKDRSMMDHLNKSLIPGYRKQLYRNASLQRKLSLALNFNTAELLLDEMFFLKKISKMFYSKSVIEMNDKTNFVRDKEKIRPKIEIGDIEILFYEVSKNNGGYGLAFVSDNNKLGIVFKLSSSEVNFIEGTRKIEIGSRK